MFSQAGFICRLPTTGIIASKLKIITTRRQYRKDIMTYAVLTERIHVYQNYNVVVTGWRF